MMLNSTLDELAHKEEKLIALIDNFKGYLEEKDAFNQKSGIYSQFAQIFLEYAHLALNGNIEALKRAIFYIWYQQAEPYELSGIKNIDNEAAVKIVSMLESMMLKNALDAELKWMLNWYTTDSWIFESFLKSTIFEDFKRQDHFNTENCDYEQFTEIAKTENSKYNYKNRGQLGNYWLSVSRK